MLCARSENTRSRLSTYSCVSRCKRSKVAFSLRTHMSDRRMHGTSQKGHIEQGTVRPPFGCQLSCQLAKLLPLGQLVLHSHALGWLPASQTHVPDPKHSGSQRLCPGGVLCLGKICWSTLGGRALNVSVTKLLAADTRAERRLTCPASMEIKRLSRTKAYSSARSSASRQRCRIAIAESGASFRCPLARPSARTARTVVSACKASISWLSDGASESSTRALAATSRSIACTSC